MSSDPSVEMLCQRLRAADRSVRCEAAKALFAHFHTPLRRHIRCELARWHKRAEPIAQDESFHSRVETHVNSALLKLLERLERGPLRDEDEMHFLAYLKTIVHNALATQRRRAARRRLESAEVLDHLETREPAVLDRLAAADERDHAERTLAERGRRLSSDEQRLIALYRAGASYRQIAEQLGGTPGQHRARMGRILCKLR